MFLLYMYSVRQEYPVVYRQVDLYVDASGDPSVPIRNIHRRSSILPRLVPTHIQESSPSVIIIVEPPSVVESSPPHEKSDTQVFP